MVIHNVGILVCDDVGCDEYRIIPIRLKLDTEMSGWPIVNQYTLPEGWSEEKGYVLCPEHTRLEREHGQASRKNCPCGLPSRDPAYKPTGPGDVGHIWCGTQCKLIEWMRGPPGTEGSISPELRREK